MNKKMNLAPDQIIDMLYRKKTDKHVDDNGSINQIPSIMQYG